MNDDEILERLADVWRERDPVPPGLADRMARYARGESALLTTDWDRELMVLVERSTLLAGVRSAGTSALTLRFATDEVDLLVRLAGDRIDGWIVPSLRARVRLTRLDEEESATVGTAEAGDDGRFELSGLPSGAVRLHLDPLDAARPGFVTPTFEI